MVPGCVGPLPVVMCWHVPGWVGLASYLASPQWVAQARASRWGGGVRAGSYCQLSINSRKWSCLAHFFGVCTLGQVGG